MLSDQQPLGLARTRTLDVVRGLLVCHRSLARHHAVVGMVEDEHFAREVVDQRDQVRARAGVGLGRDLPTRTVADVVELRGQHRTSRTSEAATRNARCGWRRSSATAPPKASATAA